MSLTESIKQKALEVGFDLVGITDAGPIESRRLTDWLEKGYAGQMSYMHRNFDKRIHPANLLPNAKSVICVALNYKPVENKKSPHGPIAEIANFALYEDYHEFMNNLLKKLCVFIADQTRPDKCTFKICVDSVPLLERALAQQAGLGFIAKNHMLINPELGLQLLLGEIITDLELTADEPMLNKCPDCCKCIRACPTGALSFTGDFDARKCISYLTIEHAGEIDDGLMRKIGTKIFGCDECILACPYDLNAPPYSNTQFKFFGKRYLLQLDKIINWDSSIFEKHFVDSTIQRSGLERLKRNAQICLANTGGHQGTRKASSSLEGDSQPE